MSYCTRADARIYIYANIYMCINTFIGDDQQRDSMLCATKRDGRLPGRMLVVVLGHQRGHFPHRLLQRL